MDKSKNKPDHARKKLICSIEIKEGRPSSLSKWCVVEAGDSNGEPVSQSVLILAMPP